MQSKIKIVIIGYVAVCLAASVAFFVYELLINEERLSKTGQPYTF